MIIFNDFYRNNVQNDDAVITTWFMEDVNEQALKPHAIICIDCQSLKQDAKEDVQIMSKSYANEGPCSIIGDASCGCCK